MCVCVFKRFLDMRKLLYSKVRFVASRGDRSYFVLYFKFGSRKHQTGSL